MWTELNVEGTSLLPGGCGGDLPKDVPEVVTGVSRRNGGGDFGKKGGEKEGKKRGVNQNRRKLRGWKRRVRN